MYPTRFQRAQSTDEAVALMREARDGQFVSGGQTLLATMKQRLAAPSNLIDLRHIDAMKGITIHGLMVTIGAATVHAEVAASVELLALCPATCDLAAQIGDPHVRNMGTLGGSIANNDPAADYPAAMLGLDASVMTTKRTLAAGDFFTGLFETALEHDEIVTAITFAAPKKAAYCKFANPASRYALAGVFVAQSEGGEARVAVTGAGNDGVFRWGDAEAALGVNWSGDALDDHAVAEEMTAEDIHANAVYRANLVRVLARRAVEAAG